jgi:hypothetical protein
MSALEAGAGGEVLRESLRRLDIEAQEECHDNRPESDATLDRRQALARWTSTSMEVPIRLCT